jgi:hypothetical protein
MGHSSLQLSTTLFCTVVPLHLRVLGILHCSFRVYHKRGALGFCVVFTNSSAVLEILNLLLPPSISFRTDMSLVFR